MILITDYFDVGNATHREAYQQLEISGHWEEGFLPDDIDMDPSWQIILLQKMYNWYKKDKEYYSELYREAAAELRFRREEVRKLEGDIEDLIKSNGG